MWHSNHYFKALYYPLKSSIWLGNLTLGKRHKSYLNKYAKITEYIWVVHVLGSKDSHYCSMGHKKVPYWGEVWVCSIGWGEAWEQGGEPMDALPHEYFRK